MEPRKEFDNILYLLGNISIDEIVNTIVFQKKYLTEPPRKGEYVAYNFQGREIYISLQSINDIVEGRYKIKFTVESYY
ncbi:MAG: hypothetical protein QXV69_08230 [Sulfolobaceae archaeon]